MLPFICTSSPLLMTLEVVDSSTCVIPRILIHFRPPLRAKKSLDIRPPPVCDSTSIQLQQRRHEASLDSGGCGHVSGNGVGEASADRWVEYRTSVRNIDKNNFLYNLKSFLLYRKIINSMSGCGHQSIITWLVIVTYNNLKNVLKGW